MNIDLFCGGYSRKVLFGDGSIFDGKGKGIYRLQFASDSGKLYEQYFLDTPNPSFVVVNHAKTVAYTVNELEEYEGEKSGSVSCFLIGEKGFQHAGTKATHGTDPCHAALSPDEKYLMVSNYGSGSLCVYALKPDGMLGEQVQFIQHEGHGKDPVRQEGPHCHSTVFSPDGRFAYVAELGMDCYLCYQYTSGQNEKGSVLIPTRQKMVSFPAGSGPRMLTFSPDGRFACVIHELASRLDVFSYSPEDGTLSWVQSVSTLADEAEQHASFAADLRYRPDGKFLYASNRGHDSISVFSVDNESGKLKMTGNYSCGGRTPRNFAIDHSGSYLFCANQDSDSIITFQIDRESGSLKQVSSIEEGSPSCIYQA